MTGKHLNSSLVPLLPIAWHIPDLFLQGCKRLRNKQEHARCTGAVLVPPKMLSICNWRQLLIRLLMLLRAWASPAGGHELRKIRDSRLEHKNFGSAAVPLP